MSIPIYIEVRAEVRFWEDAVVNGITDDDGTRIPFRVEDSWCPIIRLSDGQVQDWPDGVKADVHFKVCDAGEYWLLDADRRRVAKWAGDYVPDKFLCHEDEGWGDYIILNIGGKGRIAEWSVPQIEPDRWTPIETKGVR